jgi:hypothetical protein
MFVAHGIPAVIGAEHHAGMLAGLGSGFLSLDIWVDDDDQEAAAALLDELRAHAPREPDDDDGFELDDPDDPDDPDESQRSLAAPARGSLAHAAAGGSVYQRTERRRRTAVVLLLGCVITFGTAHMFTRAWRRGIALAAIEVVGLLHLVAGRELGPLVVIAAIVVDVVGALWRVRTAPRTVLPRARLRA